MRPIRSLSRRGFLSSVGLAAGGIALANLFPRGVLAAGDPMRNRKFVFAYFEGGWDLLVGLDPRDPAITNPRQHAIQPAYDTLGGYAWRGVQRAAGLSFGPAVPPSLLAVADECSIVNAISMDTAAHEVGRRYFITGRFPRGLAAVGSSTASEVLAQMGESSDLPHLSLRVEAYSLGLPAYAQPLMVNSLTDLLGALRPMARLDPEVLSAVEAYQDLPATCVEHQLDGDGLASQLRKSVQRSRAYLAAEVDRIFDVSRTDPEMAALRALYRVDEAGGDMAAPEILALIAGQAVKAGVSQCVSLCVANGLDTHANWAQEQLPRQERGWRALAALITDLKNTPSKDDPTKSMLDETTLVAFSEFGRTPMLNGTQGRDHFLGNSVLLAGAGIRHGVTVGQSADVGMMPLETELVTGKGVEKPAEEQRVSGAVQMLTPRHVLATMLASANLDWNYLRAPPIPALLPGSRRALGR